MGMNYYAIQTNKIVSLNRQKEKALEECGTMIGLIPIVTAYFDDNISNIKRIHIGKSSYGWEFLFNLNEKLYYHDKKSLIDFLKNNTIQDEYGRKITFDNFWNTVVLNRINAKQNRSVPLYAEHYIVIDGLEFMDQYFS